MAPKWLKKHQSLGLELGSEESVRITELVYFARAELKKGIVLFCDALDRLSKRNLPEFTVTFLGKFPGSSGIIPEGSGRPRGPKNLKKQMKNLKKIQKVSIF